MLNIKVGYFIVRHERTVKRCKSSCFGQICWRHSLSKLRWMVEGGHCRGKLCQYLKDHIMEWTCQTPSFLLHIVDEGTRWRMTKAVPACEINWSKTVSFQSSGRSFELVLVFPNVNTAHMECGTYMRVEKGELLLLDRRCFCIGGLFECSGSACHWAALCNVTKRCKIVLCCA